MKRIKVLWICEISNPKVRSHLNLHNPKTYWKNIVKKMIGRRNGLLYYFDRGVWNTLAIEEYEKLDNVELHVVSPFVGMKKEFESFSINNIHYYFIKIKYPIVHFGNVTINSGLYQNIRKKVCEIIEAISPDVINMIGAENPEYAVCAQDIDTTKYPFMLSMQTALSDPDFKKMYPISEEQYVLRSSIEQLVFKKAQYISHDAKWYRDVASMYNHNAIFTRYYLCSKQYNRQNLSGINKEFDFVYYALSIEKGAEDAIRSFYYACKEEPLLTMNIIGRYSDSYYLYIKELINRLKLEDNIVFSGFFEKQEDALKQVMKAKAAVVPIKVDIVSGTVREPMVMGIPVVTYITKGTPSLNKEKETVLLAPIGDYKRMGKNMLRLYRDPNLAQMLRANAFEYANKYWNNECGVSFNVALYKEVYNHFHQGVKIHQVFLDTIY